MRILHTADWHWGDRLGGFNRTADIRRVVEQIAGYLDSEQVDVLLIAGDLFSEILQRDELREAIEAFNKIFRPFLARQGTIVAITGNHDCDVFCNTLRAAFVMASPTALAAGATWPNGRFHLATGPTYFSLRDRADLPVQFALMPYPSVARYLTSDGQRYADAAERHRRLSDAFQSTLQAIYGRLDLSLPSVLAAHIYVQGASLGAGSKGAYKLSESDDIVFAESSVPTHWAYTALGHIHQPQMLSGLEKVRYSGSPERLDMGERCDDKGCVVFDVGPDGLIDSPRVLPLAASTFYDIVLADIDDLKRIDELYPNAKEAYVKLRATYRPGEHDRLALERQIAKLFPKCYDRHLTPERHQPQPAATQFDELVGEDLNAPPTPAEASVPSVTRQYLRERLRDDPDRDALLALADEILEDRS